MIRSVSSRNDRTWMACALALSCLVAASQPARGAALIYGYAHTGKRLVSFYSDAPGDLVGDVALSGLDANEFLGGLDFRPATGALYAIANSSGAIQLVTIEWRRA